MGGVQYLVAQTASWNVSAFAGGGAGLAVAVLELWFRAGERIDAKKLAKAFIPYFILIAIIVVGQFLLRDLLNTVQLSANFPEVTTTRGWVTPAGRGRSISLFGHGGALLLYTCALTFLYFRTQNIAGYDGRSILKQTVSRSRKTTISVYALVAMATIMQMAGMTNAIAEALAQTGAIFPLLSPFIGGLGAFMTGSNTNSNVVFSALQLETARTLGLPTALILAGQTAGGSIGSIFAPAKIVVGCSTVAGAEESAVLRTVTAWGLGIVAILGVLVALISLTI